jgi:hypothetical protein
VWWSSSRIPRPRRHRVSTASEGASTGRRLRLHLSEGRYRGWLGQVPSVGLDEPGVDVQPAARRPSTAVIGAERQARTNEQINQVLTLQPRPRHGASVAPADAPPITRRAANRVRTLIRGHGVVDKPTQSAKDGSGAGSSTAAWRQNELW